MYLTKIVGPFLIEYPGLANKGGTAKLSLSPLQGVRDFLFEEVLCSLLFGDLYYQIISRIKLKLKEY